MSIGMTYQEFYEEDPRLVRVYHEAEMLKVEKQNTYLWLQGQYFYEGMSAAFANFSAGFAGKIGKAEYRKEPIRITPKTEKEIQAEKQRKLEAYIESLKEFQAAFNRRKEQEENVR